MLATRDIIAKVRKIEIKTRRVVEEITGGAYHSVFKGRGIEFSEVREYAPEDDVRDIDWNVTARMGSPFIKKYVEERELTVIVAIDVSSSGLFGGGEKDKREQMAETAALLAFSAIRNNDKVGLLIFTDRVELYLPPKAGRLHGLRVIREIVATEPKGRGTDIAGALESLARALKKKAVVFLISDLIDSKDFERAMKTVNRRHDLIAIRTLDKFELELPPLAGMLVEDAETGELCGFDGSSASSLAAYSAEAAKMHSASAASCKKAKVDVIDLRCGDDLVKPLLAFFKMRSGKR